MRIRVLGGGWYGCHIADALAGSGHDVELHETREAIFQGASGSIPARLHQGFHYPRSRLTRAACLDHAEAFMARYGHLTMGVPVNIYAIAADRSQVDFAQYVQTLRGEVEFVTIARPEEFGLRNVEGAVLTGERHILTDRARAYFENRLNGRLRLNAGPWTPASNAEWDWTVDCTFCANESAGVDRYEPCLVLKLRGPVDRAVTIMDGPFPSLYPWDEARQLNSLSSALWTPFNKELRRYEDAQRVLREIAPAEISHRAVEMIAQMAEFYPAVLSYELVDHMLSIRAMPLSGADSRLVDVVQTGERMLRVRAGKIDAVIHAEKMVRELME